MKCPQFGCSGDVDAVTAGRAVECENGHRLQLVRATREVEA